MPEPSPNPGADSPQITASILGYGLVVAGWFSALISLIELNNPPWFVGMLLCITGVQLYGHAKRRKWWWRLIWSLLCLPPLISPPLLLLAVPFLLLAVSLSAPRPRSGEWIVTVVAFLSFPAMIPVPGFIDYRARAIQSEAKVGLEGIFAAATAMYADRETFVISDINQLGYTFSGTQQSYSLWYAVHGVPTMIPLPKGSSFIKGPCDVTTPPTAVQVVTTATGFTAAAKGNLDRDATCDEWSINVHMDAYKLENTLNDRAR